jgi:nitrogen regulatory protein PII
MKLITAIIQPFMLTKVMHQLESVPGFPGMTVSDVRGFGREKLQHRHRPGEETTDFVKKVRIDIAAPDVLAAEIVNALAGAAHTGNEGDGKVFVYTIESAVRIKTGEAGDAAL